MPIPPGIPAGNITLADIFNMLSGIRVDIGKALEKIAAIEQINKNADAIHSGFAANIAQLDSRIRVLAGVDV